MDAQEWAACCDPDVLLKWLQRSKRCQQSARKLRLFSCACCRRRWQKLDPLARAGVELAEAYADGLADEQAVVDCRRTIEGDSACVAWALWLPSMTYLEMTRHETAARSAAGYARGDKAAEAAAQCELLRDIVFHPFERAVVIDRAWFEAHDGCVRKLAQTVYAERTFETMPVLADALEEAGCDWELLLAHCRGPGSHTRGCWALDLVLDKR